MPQVFHALSIRNIVSKEWISGLRETRFVYVGRRSIQPRYAQGQVWIYEPWDTRRVRVASWAIGCPICGTTRMLDRNTVQVDGEKVTIGGQVVCAPCGIVYEVKDGKLTSLKRMV